MITMQCYLNDCFMICFIPSDKAGIQSILITINDGSSFNQSTHYHIISVATSAWSSWWFTAYRGEPVSYSWPDTRRDLRGRKQGL